MLIYGILEKQSLFLIVLLLYILSILIIGLYTIISLVL